jgi:hypothetical protein
LKNGDLVLKEAGKLCKRFTKEEAKLIREGDLDVTQFFVNKVDSKQRLLEALRGRPIYPEKEMDEIVQKGKELREEIEAFRKKH